MAKIPGTGQITDAEQALRDLAEVQERQRRVNGNRLARALYGSRAARRALGERMAAVTRQNWAGDRRNEDTRG